MSETDWRLLKSVQRNPRKPYASIAYDTGISRRTVERRLQRLIEAKALFAMPTIIPGALAGTVLASLRVVHSREDSLPLRRKISEELDDYIWHTLFMVSGEPSDPNSHTLFNLALPSVAKATEILARVKREVAARNPMIDLWEECITMTHAQDHYFEAKLASLGID
jgi:DNA-binding Lrp family transcriptional regulator